MVLTQQISNLFSFIFRKRASSSCPGSTQPLRRFSSSPALASFCSTVTTTMYVNTILIDQSTCSCSLTVMLFSFPPFAGMVTLCGYRPLVCVGVPLLPLAGRGVALLWDQAHSRAHLCGYLSVNDHFSTDTHSCNLQTSLFLFTWSVLAPNSILFFFVS